MAKNNTDILIVGGGLTGATLMLALQGIGYDTLLIETKPFTDKIYPDFDARSLALSPASKRILSQLGMWDLLKESATNIEMIHVSDQHRFGATRLMGEKNNPLGHVVEIQYINQALHQLVNKKKIIAPASLTALDLESNLATISTGSGTQTIKAQLIVAADGTESPIRKICNLATKNKIFNQHAIVANIGLANPHGQRAYERFTQEGPLALLPLNENRMSLVWAMPPEKTMKLMNLNDADFLNELQKAFGYRLGRFIKTGKRFSYPLKQSVMPEQAKWPVVFVGNAAHTLHPVAGQGFNLGLRDVAALAQCIKKWGLNKEMLTHYVHLRTHDQQIITELTKGLINLFTSRIPGVGLARNLGLIAVDNIPILKNVLTHYARGFGGITPDLACGIPLEDNKFPNEAKV